MLLGFRLLWLGSWPWFGFGCFIGCLFEGALRWFLPLLLPSVGLLLGPAVGSVCLAPCVEGFLPLLLHWVPLELSLALGLLSPFPGQFKLR